MIRILTDCVLVLGILLAPWWVVLPLAVLGLFVFQYYAEAVALGLIADIVFAAAAVGFPWLWLGMLGAFLAVQALKSRLRVYDTGSVAH
ncbi:MAG: hypothetical protein WD049_09460 [Candidatus Paceibacterota bacterium]